MIKIVAPTPHALSDGGIKLPHYLAVEEWVARSLPPAEYFFTWRVRPTVIFGRNQDPRAEVDLEYCREHGIEVYRRRSGGGCVYADLDNLMLSYITPSTDVTSTFASYSRRLADALVSIGVDARCTGRNDVVIDGRKISGNAFYRLPGRSIVHGTLLHKADLETMSHAITPSVSKLASKSVKSVDSRVTMLSEYLPDMSVTDLEAYLLDTFTDAEYILSDNDLAEIDSIEQAYYDLTWIFGHRGILASVRDQMHIRKRIEGVGDINIIVTLDGDSVRAIDMTGDFFMLSDLDSSLFGRLIGRVPVAASLREALCDVDVSQIIRGLDTDSFIFMLDEAYTLRAHETGNHPHKGSHL